MSRRKKYKGRPLGKPELRQRFFDTLKNIKSMCDIYDQGNFEIYASMTTELSKLFMEGDGKLIRNEFFYLTSKRKVHAKHLTPQHPLVYVRSQTNVDGTGSITHAHVLSNPQPNNIEEVKFNEWWEKEIVFLDSPPRSGVREKLTRQQVIKLVRNKIGAHTDKEIPLVLDRLFDRRSWGNVIASQIQVGEDLETAMQRDNVINAPIHAMVRQICAEVLKSIPQE